MKKRAIIYTRVSTDEQNNGYSPADQKDKLLKYCGNNNVDVVGFYHDDESGKSFDRPEWIKIMQFIKKNQGYIDHIYVLKWDRFSRNVAEAYITINTLKKYGVEPQSIEQPLDFEIPESKIMLAIYLAAPEVDNDRRALNIFHGIRRGKKEGRWLGACLKGYKNIRDENNRPIIAPEGGAKEALVKRAFSEFATGLYNIEELRLKLYKEGLKATRNSFWEFLRNKGYIGKVLVPTYKSEPAHWVDGIHKPLIDDDTFYAVQDILEGRKKKLPNKFQTVRDEFPLRGFLICPRCGRNLTASSSKGRHGGLFYYYHCSHGCKERQKASLVNTEFEALLSGIVANAPSINLLGTILKNGLKNRNSGVRADLEKLQKDIGRNKQRLKNAKDMVLDGEITAEDYKDMKYEIEEELARLNSEDSRLRGAIENYGSIVDDSLEVLRSIDKYYKSKNTAVKQRIVGSLYPEKLIFENSGYRTPKPNNIVRLLDRFSADFRGNKKGKVVDFNKPSPGVVPTGIEPVTQGFSVLCSTN